MFLVRSLPHTILGFLLALITPLLGFSAPGGSGTLAPGGLAKGRHSGAYPFKVVATTAMIADAARAIGGDRVAVSSLMGPGVDPHLYSPTRDDLTSLMSARVVLHNGLHLEGRLGDVLDRMASSRTVVALGDHLAAELLLRDTASGTPDPHIWMDPVTWKAAAAVVAETLTAYDPASSEAYRLRAAAYVGQIDRLDRYAREAFESIPASARVLVTAHDAFAYLGRRYGIEVHGIQGLSTESEAGLRDINNLVDLITARKVPAVFVESSVAEKNVRALVEGAAARGHTIRIGGSLFSDAMGSEGTYEGTYIGMLDHNVTTIVRALGGNAPESGMNGRLAAAGAAK